MPKYMNKPPLTKQQEQEIFPLMDAALELPFGKAILYPCSVTRATYLFNIINGERYRNAVESTCAYREGEPLYGKGIYYHLVVSVHDKGLLVAHVETPPTSVVWDIIQCMATKSPVDIKEKLVTAQSRLKKNQEKHPELNAVYIDAEAMQFRCSIPNTEEMAIVDIDLDPSLALGRPTPEQVAKAKLVKTENPRKI
jgi:hypothetical protein